MLYMCAHAWCVCLFTGFLMPSGSCVNVLPVYYAIRMVNENTTTVVSSQFLNKGYHSACCLFSLCSLLFLSMPPVVDDPNRSIFQGTTWALLSCWVGSTVENSPCFRIYQKPHRVQGKSIAGGMLGDKRKQKFPNMTKLFSVFQHPQSSS